MSLPLRLLLIEDVEDHALLMVRELRKGGFDPTFERVETPQELEAALDTGPWDAVISDFNLPGFNGLDALRIIQKKGLDLPFILVSGVIGEEMAVESMKAGAHDFILKGNLARLVPALERELGDAVVRRERRQAVEELRLAHAELEKRIAERTADLQAANTKLLDSRRAALNMMEDAVIARRQAEEASHELQREATKRKQVEERFRLLVEGVGDYAIIMLDPEGLVMSWNSGAERIKGYCQEEIVGRHFSCFYPPEVVAEGLPERELRIAERDGRYEDEGWRVRKDGSQFWANVIITTIRDENGRITGFSKITRDLTERKQAEEELQKAHDELELRVRERTEELATTVETLLGEITVRERAEISLQRLNRLYAVLSETDKAIVRASDRDSLFNDFCRIAVEHGGFLLSWVGLVDEESNLLRRVAAFGATDYLDDIRITTDAEPAGEGPTGISVRQGTYFICNDFQNDPCTRPWHERGKAHGVHASASIALKQEGRVIGALTLYADTKDFFDKQQEELLLQMGTDISFALDNLEQEARRRQAEQALQEETLERLRAVEELRKKEQLLIQQNRLAAMGEMIGNIAHQWRQPLNTLGLIIQELAMSHKFGTLTKDNLHADVAKAKQVINHMSHTIDDFRNFFRPDKEKVSFKVNDILAKTVSLIDGSLREQRIKIEISAEETISIHGYPNEYSQVILNILINARDAFAERKTDGPRVILVRLFREDDKAVLTISDNAGGIAAEIMAKIFEPYFTTKGPDKGTGVGLFMSKTIIEKNMGGRLSACNSGNGAEFRIEV